MKNNTLINLPYNIKTIMWKNKENTNKNEIVIVNLISNDKFFKMGIVINNKSIFIDKWSNSISIINNKLNDLNNKTNCFFNSFLKSWNIYLFNKIKFKGKGFRIKMFKKSKLIKFYFGRSHKTFVILKKIKKKRINKYKFMLISLKKEVIMKNSVKICKIKPINIYTLRGLRISKQIIFKRKGKKGTYI